MNSSSLSKRYGVSDNGQGDVRSAGVHVDVPVTGFLLGDPISAAESDQ